MTFAWTPVQQGNTQLKGPHSVVNPYEDWEFATRPDVDPQTTKPLERWQPVYVRLHGRPPYAKYADLLLAALTTRKIAIGADVQDLLKDIDQTKPDVAPRFFVFRPEYLAYTTDADGIVLPYEVIEVGPAIPLKYVDETARDRTEYAAWGAPPNKVRGTEVVTAVIDDFIGIANERFRDGAGQTRFHKFWAQGMPILNGRGPANLPHPVIGNEWDKKEIDAKLKGVSYEPDFYQKLFPNGLPIILPAGRGTYPANLYDPLFERPFSFAATHGTHVADIAAGYPKGPAPGRSPIVAVQLPQLATYETWGSRLDLFILLGVMRVLYWADRWTEADGKKVRAPVVINISYGVHAGSKDGTGFLEGEIARLVSARNAKGYPTAVVLPSGNAYRAQTHARMTLQNQESQGLTLRVQPEDLSVSFAELWLEDFDQATLTIAPPAGPSQSFSLTPTAQVWNWQRTGPDGTPVTVGRLYVQPQDTGRTRIMFALCPTLNHGDPPHTALPGAYGMTLRNDAPKLLEANWDVQRDDTPSAFPSYGRQAYFDHETVSELDPQTYRYDLPTLASPVKRENTLSAHATSTGKNIIVVGGAFDRDALSAAALYASSGPSCGPRKTPDLSAISEETRAHPGILAAGTFSGSAALFTGTSVAAPQVTRAIVKQWSALTFSGTDITISTLPGDQVTTAYPQLGEKTLTFAPQSGRPERRLPK